MGRHSQSGSLVLGSEGPSESRLPGSDDHLRDVRCHEQDRNGRSKSGGGSQEYLRGRVQRAMAHIENCLTKPESCHVASYDHFFSKIPEIFEKSSAAVFVRDGYTYVLSMHDVYVGGCGSLGDNEGVYDVGKAHRSNQQYVTYVHAKARLFILPALPNETFTSTELWKMRKSERRDKFWKCFTNGEFDQLARSGVLKPVSSTKHHSRVAVLPMMLGARGCTVRWGENGTTKDTSLQGGYCVIYRNIIISPSHRLKINRIICERGTGPGAQQRMERRCDLKLLPSELLLKIFLSAFRSLDVEMDRLLDSYPVSHDLIGDRFGEFVDSDLGVESAAAGDAAAAAAAGSGEKRVNLKKGRLLSKSNRASLRAVCEAPIESSDDVTLKTLETILTQAKVPYAVEPLEAKGDHRESVSFSSSSTSSSSTLAAVGGSAAGSAGGEKAVQAFHSKGRRKSLKRDPKKKGREQLIEQARCAFVKGVERRERKRRDTIKSGTLKRNKNNVKVLGTVEVRSKNSRHANKSSATIKLMLRGPAEGRPQDAVVAIQWMTSVISVHTLFRCLGADAATVDKLLERSAGRELSKKEREVVLSLAASDRSLSTAGALVELAMCSNKRDKNLTEMMEKAVASLPMGVTELSSKQDPNCKVEALDAACALAEAVQFARHTIRKQVLPHVGCLDSDNSAKAIFLSKMLWEVVDMICNDRPQTDRDSFKLDTYETPGAMISSLLRRMNPQLTGHIRNNIRRFLKQAFGEAEKAAAKKFKDRKQQVHWAESQVHQRMTAEGVMPISLSAKLTNCVRSGIFSLGGPNSGRNTAKRSGMTVSDNGQNPFVLSSMLSRVRKPNTRLTKWESRQPDPTHSGFLSILHTPITKDIGSVRHLACTAVVTQPSCPFVLEELLKARSEDLGLTFHPSSRGLMSSYVSKSIDGISLLYINNKPSAEVSPGRDPDEVAGRIIDMKIRGDIDYYASVWYDEDTNCVHVVTTGNRLVRPLVVGSTEEGHVLGQKEYERVLFGCSGVADLKQRQLVEWCDVNEIPDRRVTYALASNESKARNSSRHRRRYYDIVGCELSAQNRDPFVGSNQAARTARNSSMVPQGMMRRDYKRYPNCQRGLVFPQTHVVNTAFAQNAPFDKLGVEVRLALYGHYNQEDCLVVSKDSVERMMGASIKKLTTSSVSKGDPSRPNLARSEKHVRIEKPPSKNIIGKKPGSYAYLDTNGIAVVGAELQKGDIVIGRTRMPPRCQTASLGRLTAECVDFNGSGGDRHQQHQQQQPDTYSVPTSELGHGKMHVGSAGMKWLKDMSLEGEAGKVVHVVDVYRKSMVSSGPGSRMGILSVTDPNIITENIDQSLRLRGDDADASEEHKKKTIDLLGVVNREGATQRIVRVVQNSLHLMSEGDKIKFPAAQKGTITELMQPSEMPFDEDGYCPDVMLNPHSIPSRMTMSVFLIMIQALLASSRMHTECATAKSFSHSDSSEDALRSCAEVKRLHPRSSRFSADRTCASKMTDGRTGRELHTDIFMAPGPLSPLKRVAAPQNTARGKGPINPITHQPTEGRSKQGGQRTGNMETATYHAHGASRILHQVLSKNSDGCEMVLCQKCQVPAVYNGEQGRGRCLQCGDHRHLVRVESVTIWQIMLNYLIGMGIQIQMKTKREHL